MREERIERILFHGTDHWSHERSHILSGYDENTYVVFFSDNRAYAETYARFRGGNILVLAKLDLKNPAKAKDIHGLFGDLGEDPSTYEGWHGLKKRGFDGYISNPGFDTPDSRVYETPEFYEDQKKSDQKMLNAKHIDFSEFGSMENNGNYAIHAPMKDIVDNLELSGREYDIYEYDFVREIYYVSLTKKVRKSYHSVNYVAFYKEQVHIVDIITI